MYLAALLISLVLVCISSVHCQLNGLARANKKLYFGTATDNPELRDTPYVKQLGNTNDFGQLTPGNSMKWYATEPKRGVFDFTAGDRIVALAKKNKQLVRGHNCVWHDQLAPWVEAGNFDNATLTSIIKMHCSTLVKHYKGQIYSWDVINEPFNEDGSFRKSVFFKTTGTSFIRTALRAAHAADPKAKLYINDYNIEGLSPKSTAMLNLVKQLKAEAVPIHGIGFQGHFVVGKIPTTIRQNLQAFVDLGVEVALTELDIRMNLPATPKLLAQQKTDYATVVAACKALTKCVGVTIWDWTDKYSWIPGDFNSQGSALPWDTTLVKKPAYFGIVDGWNNYH